MQKKSGSSFIRYFRKPLLGISAATAYNMPNSCVHLPVVLMVVYTGVYICSAGVKPLLPVYFLVALYLARDLTVMSYRNKQIPVIVWIVFISFVILKDGIKGVLMFDQPLIPVKITIAVLIGFILYITLHLKYSSGQGRERRRTS